MSKYKFLFPAEGSFSLKLKRLDGHQAVRFVPGTIRSWMARITGAAGSPEARNRLAGATHVNLLRCMAELWLEFASKFSLRGGMGYSLPREILVKHIAGQLTKLLPDVKYNTLVTELYMASALLQTACHENAWPVIASAHTKRPVLRQPDRLLVIKVPVFTPGKAGCRISDRDWSLMRRKYELARTAGTAEAKPVMEQPELPVNEETRKAEDDKSRAEVVAGMNKFLAETWPQEAAEDKRRIAAKTPDSMYPIRRRLDTLEGQVMHLANRLDQHEADTEYCKKMLQEEIGRIGEEKRTCACKAHAGTPDQALRDQDVDAVIRHVQNTGRPWPEADQLIMERASIKDILHYLSLFTDFDALPGHLSTFIARANGEDLAQAACINPHIFRQPDVSTIVAHTLLARRSGASLKSYYEHIDQPMPVWVLNACSALTRA
jgi:hypothetical protein